MRISKKAEYGLIAMLAMVNRSRIKPVQIQELSDSEKIPAKFLEQILLSLKKGGLLESKRGVGGGYRLAREPDRIRVSEIVKLIDGPLQLVVSPHGDSDGLSVYFATLHRKIEEHFNGYTLRDVADLGGAGHVLNFDI